MHAIALQHLRERERHQVTSPSSPSNCADWENLNSHDACDWVDPPKDAQVISTTIVQFEGELASFVRLHGASPAPARHVHCYECEKVGVNLDMITPNFALQKTRGLGPPPLRTNPAILALWNVQRRILRLATRMPFPKHAPEWRRQPSRFDQIDQSQISDSP